MERPGGFKVQRTAQVVILGVHEVDFKKKKTKDFVFRMDIKSSVLTRTGRKYYTYITSKGNSTLKALLTRASALIKWSRTNFIPFSISIGLITREDCLEALKPKHKASPTINHSNPASLAILNKYLNGQFITLLTMQGNKKNPRYLLK